MRYTESDFTFGMCSSKCLSCSTLHLISIEYSYIKDLLHNNKMDTDMDIHKN